MSQFVEGARCSICGNGGPSAPGARYACVKPLDDTRSCPFAEPKPHKMQPEDVIAAHFKLKELTDLEVEIGCIESKTLQIVFAGHYYGEGFPDAQAAARVGLLKLWHQKRATKIAELRGLGVEMAE